MRFPIVVCHVLRNGIFMCLGVWILFLHKFLLPQIIENTREIIQNMSEIF